MLSTAGAVAQVAEPYNRSVPPFTLYYAGKINENLNRAGCRCHLQTNDHIGRKYEGLSFELSITAKPEERAERLLPSLLWFGIPFHLLKQFSMDGIVVDAKVSCICRQHVDEEFLSLF